MEPHPLAPNVFEHFYRGGEQLAALRALPPPPGAGSTPLRRPEEWLGSTVTRWGSDHLGLTDLGAAGLLRDVVAADPKGWLGADHVARWGASPALLVKLLDAGERLPVHVHPTRVFAARHLDCPFGKSEAWIVVGAPATGGTVFVGATRPVSTEEWSALVSEQDGEAMLDLLHPVTVHPGDSVFVPAGTPHAIDAGMFVVELQEPTDFSILLEWRGFDLDGAADGHLGLGFDVALDAVRRDAVDAGAIERLVRRAHEDGDEFDRGGGPRATLPSVADPYFRAWSISAADEPVGVPAAFSVVIVLDGEGTLAWSGGQRRIGRGDAFVVSHAVGGLSFHGRVSAVVAQPPDPSSPDPVELDAHPGGVPA